MRAVVMQHTGETENGNMEQEEKDGSFYGIYIYDVPAVHIMLE